MIIRFDYCFFRDQCISYLFSKNLLIRVFQQFYKSPP